jgi:Toluene-4-monooxygenase system protein B (TmoB)
VLVPLHGFLRGDTVGLLLLVHDTDTLALVARTLIDAAAVRVAPAARARLFRGGVELALTETVAGAGLQALDRIDLIPEAALVTEAPPAHDGLSDASSPSEEVPA